jgi:sigma-B regulation protein RsbU (phosphoserine phosphatase)
LAELKLTPDEVVGKSLFDYFKTDDPKHPTIAAHLEAMRGEETTLDIDWRGRTWRSVMQPWRGEDDSIRGVIGVALDITDTIRAQKAQEDAEVAALIHRALLPQKMPELPGFDIAGISSPTGATGGDFIDFLTFLNGTLQIVVGDVCGHGTGPALLMATTRAYCRALSNVLPGLRDICETLNGLILADGVVGRFVSLFLARINPQNRTLTYTSAGHPTGYIIAADGTTRLELRSIGLLLGVSPGEDYPTRGPIPLESGEVIVILTDGLIEACPTDGKEFGTDRIVQLVHRYRRERAAVIVDRLIDEVRRHAGDAAHYDDESAVVIKVL